MNGSRLAEFACASCRRLKRKCSKQLPNCSLCSRVGRCCEYQDPSIASENGSPKPRAALHSRSVRPARETSRSNPTHTRSSSDELVHASPRPGRCFLDSVATRASHVDFARRQLLWTDVTDHPPPPSVAAAHAIVDHYTATSHLWLPVVSMKRLTRELHSSSDITSADFTALLYAMQLLTHTPSGHTYATYRAVKSVLTECEQRVILSTDFCAANVLIAMYEYGQGIFPTAYFTVSHCARIFYALGTHDKRAGTRLFGTLESRTEKEERRSLWWATVVLDKMMHAGFRFRPLSTPSIPAEEIIPAFDVDLDNGELAVDPLIMSVEANTTVGPYARTRQAAHLLGKVCEHVNEQPKPADVDLHLEEATQICRAITAFKALLDHDENALQDSHRLITARAVCLSALQLMYDTYGCPDAGHLDSSGARAARRLELRQLAIEASRAAAEDCIDLAHQIAAHATSKSAASISPLVLNALYAAASTWSCQYRETGKEVSLDKLNILRKVFGQLCNQWHACSDYLGLLEGTEHAYHGPYMS